MWENLALGTFGEFAGLPELLIDFPRLEATDSTLLDEMKLFHPSEAVPPIHNVVECQEYISKIGFEAQLTLLMSANGATLAEVERIGQIVTLANQEILYHDALLDSEAGPEKLEKYAEEMKRVIKMETLKALNGAKGSLEV